MTHEFIDSREGFGSDEELAYHEGELCDDFDGEDGDYLDYDAYLDEYDGQPDEYTEWQDYMGGDDWDHGQYDDPCDCW